MRFNILYGFLSLLVITLVAPAFAANADNAIINRIKSRYESMKSFSASFEQTLSHRESGTREKRKGLILFQKPLQIRWQTDRPHAETLVATNREIWDYIPDEEIAYRYSPDLIRDSRSVIQVVTGQAALSKDFDVKARGMENGLAKLALYPHEPTPSLVEAAIWVEPDSGIIRRANIIDFYGNGNDVRFTSFTPDASIKAGEFSFKPPKGVEVEDRMEKKVLEKDLFN